MAAKKLKPSEETQKAIDEVNLRAAEETAAAQKAIDAVRLKSAVVAALEATPNMLLTTEEAAAYKGFAPGTLAIWRCDGKGPAFVPGPRPTYTRAALDAFNPPPRRGSPKAGRPPKGSGKKRAVRP